MMPPGRAYSIKPLPLQDNHVMIAAKNSTVHVDRGARGTLPLDLVITSARTWSAPQPLSVGLPFSKGAVPKGERFCLRDERGRAIPVQSAALSCWDDGSVKWLLTDILLEETPAGETRWQLDRVARQESFTPAMLHAEESAESIRVETGAASFRLSRDTFGPFRQVVVSGVELVEGDRCETVLHDATGHG